MNENLWPQSWSGPAASISFPEFQWIKDLPGKIYCKFFVRKLSLSNDYYLPDDYDAYIISFHAEPFDIEWAQKISDHTDKPVIILCESFHTKCQLAPNVQIFNFVYWHHSLELAKKWYSRAQRPCMPIRYKASTICNRITLSKLIITTALLEYMPGQCLIKLSRWLEEKNVHHRQKTGNIELDGLMDIFYNRYLGHEMLIDDFNNDKNNYQKFTVDPWVSYLHQSALHFTNETMSYSYMIEGAKEYIYPGPYLSEKTLKCLLGGKSFVPVGQYQTYQVLRELGMRFDFPFDISWDDDPGNLTRMQSIVHLIKWLQNSDAAEIDQMVKPSADHNFDHVWTDAFYHRCQKINDQTIENLMRQFS